MTEHKKPRKRRLKVYGGNLNGRDRAIMAAGSLREFMAATGIGRDWISETGNAAEIEQAMSKPGAVFIQPMRGFGAQPWSEWTRKETTR